MPRNKKKNSHTVLHYFLTILIVFIKSIIAVALWIALGIAGLFIFQTHKSPYNIVIGLPLILASIGAIINAIGNEVLSILSPTYNRGVCVLCNN